MTLKKILGIIVIMVGIYLLVSYQLKPTLVSVLPKTEDSPIVEQVTSVDKIEKIQDDKIVKSFESRNPTESICVGEYCDGSMDDDTNFTIVKVPLVGSNGDIGCGSSIIMSPHTVHPATSAVLDATYRKLFSLKQVSDVPSDDIQNIIGLEDELLYQHVSLDDGVATLHLQGHTHVISGCMIPAFRAQIERAALQYVTVNKLQVMINDELWDWCDYSLADPSEDGCDTTQKYWVIEK